MIWVLAALLVGWGNVGSTLLAPTALLPGGSVAFVAAGIALASTAMLVAWRGGLDAAAVGLGRDGVARGAAFGLVAGASIATAGLLALQLAPLLTGAPLLYDPLRGIGALDLAVHVLVFLPLGTVLPEEVAFRGALVGFLRKESARAALRGSAAAFALWHGAVAAATVQQTTISATPWTIPAIAGALAVVFAGGYVLAWLRLLTGTIASTIAAHWSFNATLLIGLWALLPHPAPSA